MNSSGTATGAFQGTMDEARIWNVVRTQAEIQAAMGAALPGAQTGLKGRWAMDEGTGTSLADSSGNNITGTAANFTGSFWVSGTPFVSTPLAPASQRPASLRHAGGDRLRDVRSGARTRRRAVHARDVVQA